MHYILGRPGEVAIVDMRLPGWLQELHLNPHLADVELSLSSAPFTSAWVLRVVRNDVTVSAVHTDANPESGAQDHTSAALWHDVIPYIQAAVAGPAESTRWAIWKQDALAFVPGGAAQH
jgi:hypothetical protein